MKMYVIVRKDMSRSQQAVQAGHALASLLLKRKRTSWKNGTLVYLSVKNERELKKLLENLPNRYVAHFLEPYWDNSLTAIAAYGKPVSELLRKLPLL